MPDLLKHLVVLGLAVPAGIGGYHLAVSLAVHGDDAASGTAEAADLSFGRGGYQLAALPVLERDVHWLESKYVERERLDPEAMFEGALERVEREVPEVMFQREPEGRRLHVSVGDYTTVVTVRPMADLTAMSAQLREVARILDQHLSPEVERPGVEYALINGALSVLDPHTILMPPAAADEMDVDNKGEFGGLGIEITLKEGRLTIKQPIADTPASRAGLKAEDQIVRIDDESTINMDLTDAVGKLRGRKGEPVTIMVQRKGLSKARPYTIVRDIIKLNPVEGELLEGNVGYVRIKSFNAKASSDLGDLLSHFKRKAGGPLRGLVLDLRGNPGGYLTEAVDVSDAFLMDGVIVSTVDGGTGRRDEQRANRAGTAPDYPVAVLVNGNSASASEIVAGALRNQDRGVIIGERTFGKGSVQNLYNHDDGSRLKLTVAKYLTPGDRSIQAVGIPPDIELRPAMIEPARAEDDDPTPLVSLYWREWVDREADLEHVLTSMDESDRDAAWTLRYLRPRQESDAVDPQGDFEVQLAREVLLASQGSRRPEVLAAAGTVIERRRIAEEARIASAFGGLGIDWSAGDPGTASQLTAELDLGDDGVLVAGTAEQVGLVVTNHGTASVHQLSAVTLSDNPYLDHREFYFGRIDAGESRRVDVQVSLQEGYPTEVSPVTVQLRTPSAGTLSEVEHIVESRGRALPAFHYSLTLRDDGTGSSVGDGDGLPEVGETIDLEISVTNVGAGPTSDAFARVKNRSGRGLDLKNGGMEIGNPIDEQGATCDPDAQGCSLSLAPGETHTGVVTFELRELPDEGSWSLDLQVGDNRAYDFAAIQRGGFYDYFQLKESLVLSPTAAFDSTVRKPPTIKVTRGESGELMGQSLVLSGLVEDDEGLRDVMIFHGDDKVFYRGGAKTATSLPFSIERNLEPGANLLVVLARDARGLTATHAVTSWQREQLTSSLEPRDDAETAVH